MAVLFVACCTVMLAFTIHVLVWKIRLPRKQNRALLLIFFMTLLTALALLPTLAGLFPELGLPLPVPLATYLHLSLFMTAITLAYLTTYSAVEVDSPSLVMVTTIHQAGAAGLPVAVFDATMNDALLVEPRIHDLLSDGMARLDGDVYRLTPKGKTMAQLFTVQRYLLKAGMGG